MIRRPPGVLFVPAHVVPVWHPRTVVTIHDLGYLHEREAHPARQRHMLDRSTLWSSRTATKIIAISEATKRDLIQRYRIEDERIRVIHHGVSASFRRVSDDEIARVRAQYALPAHYVLFVGTVQPRKNIGRIAAAMKIVEAATLPHKLVVAGKPGWLDDQVEQDITSTGRPDLIQRVGYVPDVDLPALYAGAGAFCFPSLYEGFGLPVLEAMACGTPVVTSTRGSLPEIAGDAALLVEPASVEAIGEALVLVLSDTNLRDTLINAGQERIRQFSWRATASSTLDLLLEVRDRQEQ
jgi:glycosyltransferase involved in cell wall biosynthesis